MYRMIRSDIYLGDDGKVYFDKSNDLRGGIQVADRTYGKLQRDGLRDNSKRKDPFKSEDELLNGHTVYSVYPIRNDYHVDIFKRIKSGDMDRLDYNDFVESTASYINSQIIRLNRPDIILTPQSSSRFINDVADAVSKASRIGNLPHAFKKNPVTDILLVFPEESNIPLSTKQACEKILDRIHDQGFFEAKLVPKRMLKFFKNIYTDDEEYEDVLSGLKVAVLDDSMTSRATMANIFDVCDYLYETSPDSYGITVFKHLPEKKSDSRD